MKRGRVVRMPGIRASGHTRRRYRPTETAAVEDVRVDSAGTSEQVRKEVHDEAVRRGSTHVRKMPEQKEDGTWKRLWQRMLKQGRASKPS